MDIKLKYRAYVGEKHLDIASKLIDNDIERFAIEFSEHLLEQLHQYNVSGQSKQLESGLTCMMCRKPKQNDGHTCCEECAGLAF